MTWTRGTLVGALLLGAGAAGAEQTMRPLEVQSRDDSAYNDEQLDQDETRATDSGNEWAYRNTRDDAVDSEGEPGCWETTAHNDYDFIRRLDCGKSMGNDDFAAGYALYAGVYAWDRGADDKARLDGGLEATVTVFGRDVTVAGGHAWLESTQGGAVYGEAELVVLDRVVSDAQLDAEFGLRREALKQFVSVETTVPVAGIFTVTLGAGAYGKAGLAVEGGVADSVEITVTPYAEALGFASAAAGIAGGVVAEAGVEINLLLLGVRLPVTLEVDIIPDGAERAWSLTSSFELESLSGWLEVWVSAIAGLIEHRAVVASWDGLQRTYTLLTASGALGF